MSQPAEPCASGAGRIKHSLNITYHPLLPAILLLLVTLQACGPINHTASRWLGREPDFVLDSLSTHLTAIDSTIGHEADSIFRASSGRGSVTASRKWLAYSERTISQLSKPMMEQHAGSVLANMVADAIRIKAGRLLKKQVHLGMIHPDIIKGTLEDSLVNRKHVRELIPIDQGILSLEVSGSQVRSIAGYIADQGGMSISGLRMSVKNGRPTDILVQATTPDSASSYLLCVPETVWFQNGFSEIFDEKPTITYLDATLRMAVMEYLENRRQFRSIQDERLRLR